MKYIVRQKQRTNRGKCYCLSNMSKFIFNTHKKNDIYMYKRDNRVKKFFAIYEHLFLPDLLKLKTGN